MQLFEHDANLAATIAHELGHACTSNDDCERRGVLDDEWASELAADWYAYKWGFGRLIARDRKNRNWLHHGPAPRSHFSIIGGDTTFHYRVSRRFVARLIKRTKAE
jgi:hypothetical protein